MATAAELYDLQKIDLTWLHVRQHLQQIQAQLGENEALTTAQQRLADLEAALHKRHGQQTDAELEAQSLNKRIAETDARLMSGQVTNPKELASLQASIEALRRHLSQVEDRGVEALLEVEALTVQVADAQAAVDEIEAEWSATQGALLAEEKKMKRNYVILKRRREAAVDAMDASVLSAYERLRKRKGGVAVAPVEGEICGACHVKLPTGVVSAARDQERMVNCPSCGRILCVP